MKNALKILLILTALGFVLIQVYRPDRTNPSIVQSETLEASTDVPPEVKGILERSCNDCHSNDTDWVWYSNIAPISWGMTDHVTVGRERLNFSKWSTYSVDRKSRKLDEICEEVESGEMPFYQYQWLHWDADLSVDDVKLLCDWTKQEQEKIKHAENTN